MFERVVWVHSRIWYHKATLKIVMLHKCTLNSMEAGAFSVSLFIMPLWSHTSDYICTQCNRTYVLLGSGSNFKANTATTMTGTQWPQDKSSEFSFPWKRRRRREEEGGEGRGARPLNGDDVCEIYTDGWVRLWLLPARKDPIQNLILQFETISASHWNRISAIDAKLRTELFARIV